MSIPVPHLPAAEGAKSARFRLWVSVIAALTLAALAVGLRLIPALERADRAEAPVSLLEPVVAFDTRQLDVQGLDGFLRDLPTGLAPQAVVVHFRDPACGCSDAGDQRFLSLVRRHVGRNVVFAFSEPPGTTHHPERGLDRLPQLPPETAASLWQRLPAAPAIAVFDGEGRPLYLGAYGAGRDCSAGRGGAVEATLAALDRGQPAPASLPLPDRPCTCALTRHAEGDGPSAVALR